MTAGRKAKPTATKELQGNPGKRPLNKREPVPPIVELGEPPVWLGEYGRLEWERVGPVLIQMKVLTHADLAAFTAYCAALDQMIEAKIDLDANGYTLDGPRGPTRNPAVSVFSSAVTNLRTLAAEFGMTPSSRSRISLPGDPGDTLDDLLNAGADEELL